MSRGATRIRLGCAGWSLPKESAAQFGAEGTHLERYASQFNAVEINSTFYKVHRQSTFSRWAQSVPDDFRFSVKVPKEITHHKKLGNSADALVAFLDDVQGLGNKLETYLVQLPPTLEFDSSIVSEFLTTFRAVSSCGIACEPRHKSWFSNRANTLLAKFAVARVAADPAVVPEAAEPGGGNQLVYYRLHGSPRKYYSSYNDGFLNALSQKLQLEAKSKSVWCIFDNTASGAATDNARAVLTHEQEQQST